jgi:copper(I)-binding protein
MNRIFAALLSTLAAFLSPALAGSASDAIVVSGAYVRAVPPGQPNSAAFMTLTNTSGEDRALVAAESSIAAAVELHDHALEGGMARMRRVERIELAAGEAAALRPGGLHLMLIGISHQLEPGQEVGLSLIFDDGSRAALRLAVRKISLQQEPGEKARCGGGRCGGSRCGGGG